MIDKFQTKNNCDSIWQLNLFVAPTYRFYETYTIGENDTIYLHNQEFTKGGDFVVQFETEKYKTDSIYNIHITYEVHRYDTICDNYYLINGDTLYYTDDYEYQLKTADGVDSLFVMHLSVGHSVTINEPITYLCEGDTLLWHDRQFTQSGVFYDTIPSTLKCDSVCVLYLQVNNSYHYRQPLSICLGDTLIVNGEKLYEDGVKPITFGLTVSSQLLSALITSC